ncbi:hypothetical protein D7S89_20580 [Trinickia fusca]|uniref:WD40 repeat domain-containing protein n=2 Tax=Trinickia fusca TaxID=2419777 RepID=A0A494X3F4_9BURK|nr:hypothetical protein D7S89_20580 [Trinickia fusca]
MAAGQSVEIPLGVPEGFTPVFIDPVGSGRYCVSGEVLDDMAATTTAYVAVVDADKRQVVWKSSIPFAHDHAGSEALRCVSDSNHSAYFVLTKEDTNSSESLDQGKLFLQKFSADGKLLKQQRVGVGFDEWAYLLDVTPAGVAVAGGISDTLQRGGKFSTFVARFDQDLSKRTDFAKLPTGAYWIDSEARLDGAYLLVGGQFLANGAVSPADKPYAVSKIDIGNSRYIRSTHLYPTDVDSATPAIEADGSAFYAALTSSELLVSAVDAAGHVTQHFSLKKPLCEIKALGVQGQTLSVFGKTCDKAAVDAIATIDLEQKTVGGIQRVSGDVREVRFEGNAWVGVAVDERAQHATFRRVAR